MKRTAKKFSDSCATLPGALNDAGEEIGKIRIQVETLASMVKQAALSVEGVTRITGSNLFDNLAELVGNKKSLDRSVTIRFSGSYVAVEISINVLYGVSIPKTAAEVQKRITDAIAEARFMADYVIVAPHNHEIYGRLKENVDPVSIEFAHNCIDAGADAVISTGPHLLRPVEIYNGKPIFHCLGDFINQLETINCAPDGMFAKQNLNGNSRLDELFNARSGNGKRGLSYDRVMFESVIPYWEVENGELTKLVFLPIEEMFGLPRSRHGWPLKNTSANIIERFAEMSKPYGVDIRIENGLGVVKL